MTGLEKMVSQILEEADASAAVMISDAEKKAAEILGEAGEKADKIRQPTSAACRSRSAPRAVSANTWLCTWSPNTDRAYSSVATLRKRASSSGRSSGFSPQASKNAARILSVIS